MAKRKYGLPYQGSKSQIAEKLGEVLPSAEVFVDIFAGGCAMSDWALSSGKYQRIIANDLREPSPVALYKDVLSGKYNPDVFTPQWVSREQFNDEKSHNPYIAYGWSFGNKGRDYLFGKDIEAIKKAFHNFIIFSCDEALRQIQTTPEFNAILEKYGYIFCGKRFIDDYLVYYHSSDRIGSRQKHLYAIKQIQKNTIRIAADMEQLERLERLERLQQLQQLERLQMSQLDYRDVFIPDNAVVYCDPPYIGTKRYGKQSFNHEEFWQWVHEQAVPVFVSEYTAPDDFECVLEIEHRSTMCATNNGKRVVEKLFWNGIR